MKFLHASLFFAVVGFTGCPWMDPEVELPPIDSESGTVDETSAPTTFRVEGTVARLATAPIAPGNDGIGNIYIGAFSECAHGVPPIGSAFIEAADLSSEAHRVPFAVEGLPSGTVYFALFLDDNLNATLPAPEPDDGDPALADDVDDGLLTCIAAEVEASDVTGVELVLNLTH